MGQESDFFIKAADGSSIFVRRWSCQSPRKGVVHIVHGMAEHSQRYQHVSEALNTAGYEVFAHDHRGHGNTAKTPEKLGYFADENGWSHVLDDIHQINQLIHEEHPNKPVFLLGHSMGSFLTQHYCIKHGNTIDGALICASNGKTGALLRFGRLVAKLERLRLGPKGKSLLIHALSFGSFNKRFKPLRTDFDWLSCDKANVDRYLADPFCGFLCSNQFWYDFFGGLIEIENQTQQQLIPKELPLYIFAGEEDPVGLYGKGVKKLAKQYDKLNIQDVTLKLYPGKRHEILNETNKKEVIDDMIAWLDKRAPTQ